MTMSRRDTIVLAVLINAALLSILFFTATRPDSVPTTASVAIQIVETPVTPLPNLSLGSAFATTRIDRQDNVESSNPSFTSSYSERSAAFIEPIPVIESSQELVESNTSQASRDQPPEQYVEVMVKRGDFLEKIARTNGTTVGEIRRINNLNSDRIDIGQVLLVPAIKKTSPAIVLAPTKFDDVEYYTIKTGDNPWNIARDHRIKVDELLRMNSLDEDKARNLKPGDKIRVR